MLTGAHSIIYSTNPDADRAFLRDVLALLNVDVGLPGGGKMGIYQPRHARPPAPPSQA
jgi:hypothetical protein